MAATRPVAGQPIETLWGQEIHDVASALVGVVVQGGNTGATTGKYPLDTVVEGKASMADLANDQIVVPVAGVYECMCFLVVSGITIGSVYRESVSVNGVAWFSITGPTAGGSGVTMSAGSVKLLAAGDLVAANPAAHAGAGTGTRAGLVTRMSLRLIGQAWAS